MWITTAAVSADWTARWTPDEESGSSASAEPVAAADLSRQRAGRVAGGQTSGQARRRTHDAGGFDEPHVAGDGIGSEYPPCRGIDEHGHLAPRNAVTRRRTWRRPYPTFVDRHDGWPVGCHVPAAGHSEQRVGPRVPKVRPTPAGVDDEACAHRRPVAVERDLPARPEAPATHGVAPGDRHTELQRSVEEEGVEPVAIDEQRAPRHRANDARCFPCHCHRLGRRKSGLQHRPFCAGHRQQIQRRRGEDLACVCTTGATAIDHFDAIAELCQSSGDGRACRPRSDHRYVGYRCPVGDAHCSPSSENVTPARVSRA